MEPIISPWLIYLIYQINVFKTLLIVGSILGLAAATVTRIVIGCMRSDILDGSVGKKKRLYMRMSIKSLTKFTRKVVAVSLIFLVIGVCAPTRNLVIVMMASKYITPNNIKAAGKTVENAYKFSKEEFISLLDDVMKRVRDLNQSGVIKDNEKVSRNKKEKAM